MSNRRLRVCAAASLAWLCVAGGAWADSLQALRGEGVTLYLRHAASDWRDGQAETGSLDLARLDAKACAAQRALSDEGRRQAQSVRAALQSLSLSTGDTYSAGLCRTVEMARALGATPKIVEALTPRANGQASLRLQMEAVEKIVRAGGSGRGLRIIVGDYEVARALFGVTLAEGEGLVLQAVGEGVEAIARLRAGDWQSVQPVAASGERATPDSRKF